LERINGVKLCIGYDSQIYVKVLSYIHLCCEIQNIVGVNLQL